MVVLLPENDGLVEFANLKWSPKLPGEMTMKLQYKSYEIELKSSGIQEVLGFGYIWKIIDQNYEKIASLIITEMKNGKSKRKANCLPEPFFSQGNYSDDLVASPQITIEKFCAALQIPDKVQLFEREGFTPNELKDLTDQDLLNLGFTKMGERKRILKYISNNFSIQQ